MIVWIYVDVSKEVGDVENEDARANWGRLWTM